MKVTVRVHEYPDGTLAVFHGPRCLARYHADGRLIEAEVDAHRRKNLTPRSSARLIVDPRPTVCEVFFGARLKYAEERTGQITCYKNRTS